MIEKRNDLIGKRSAAEAELSDINTQIAHLNEILKHLSPLAGLPDGGNLATLGMTDAIRWVLEHADGRMSPKDISDKLVEKGFDLSSLSAPMGSIYKILSRLAEGDDPEITREEEDRKVYYTWKSEDSDIPF